MRIGLSVHGTTFGMGIDALSGRPVISPRELMDKAINAGLEGVELPALLMEDEDATSVARYASERGLFITLETQGYDPNTLASAIDLGAQLGAGTLRTMVGGAKLGGYRRPLAGRWQSFLQGVLAVLREATALSPPPRRHPTSEQHPTLP